jgi:4-hydroxy-3-polyprenylbenzoate decarboxylase
MVVVPCSIKSLSAIAHSYSDTLLIRAADVTLKEQRKIVLVVRETPLHLGHLRLLTEATESGAVILPPMPSFYHHPHSIEDIVDQTVGKILDQFGIEHDLFRRWGGGDTLCTATEGRSLSRR